MKTMNKVTLATLKSFIRNNKENILVKVESNFDGMSDMVEYNSGAKWQLAKETDHCVEHTHGITGVWTVNGSRDYFSVYEDEQLYGIHCSNACGSWTIAIEK